jgi:tRNA nucleotidyltransferase (CCA-adding enzyme)
MPSNYAIYLKHPVFKVVSSYIKENNLEAYVVGGYVRDLILEKPSKDIDIVVVGDGTLLAQEVAEILKVKNVSIFKNYGTAHFRYKDLDVEFVGARKESYEFNSRKPTTEKGTLRDDQFRRDFTINALALDLREEHYGNLVDPFNGLEDLRNGIIRTPLDPHVTFSDDPLRMMRAIRFAAQLSFTIEEKSLTSISKNCERIKLAKTLNDLGLKVTAVSILCQDERVWEAMEMSGSPCPIGGAIGDQARMAWFKMSKSRFEALYGEGWVPPTPPDRSE